MTREEINELNVVEPNCFENDREEQWYKVGLKEGLKVADKSMIEKVLTFIFENFYDHPHVSGHICTDAFESLEQMEEEITKLMETKWRRRIFQYMGGTKEGKRLFAKPAQRVIGIVC